MSVDTPQTPLDQSVVQKLAALYTPSVTLGDGEK